MSRATFTNAKYTFVFGVDHTPMGTFFQVYDRGIPKDDEDTPHFEYDALFGPRGDKRPEVTEALNSNGKLFRVIDEFKKMWPTNKERGTTNLGVQHIVEVARALGFTKPDIDVIQRKAYELWD